MPLPVVHVPPIFDGISTYDANADVPLRLPCHLLRAGSNTLTLRCTDVQPHVAAVVAVAAVSFAEVHGGVVAKGVAPAAAAAVHIERLFGGDSEVETSKKVISLNCPLSTMRLKQPSRSSECKHLECFDLEAYLQCQHVARFARWRCPVCSAVALPEHLQLDGWMADVRSTHSNTHERRVAPPNVVTGARRGGPRRRRD